MGQVPMMVELNNNEAFLYDIDSIERLTFTNGLPAHIMKLFTEATLPPLHEYEAQAIDSMIFEGPDFAKSISVFRDGTDIPDRYPVAGNFPVDSIIFEQLLFDTNITPLLSYWEYLDCDTKEPTAGYPTFSSWATNGKLYASAPLTQFTINSNIQVLQDSTFCTNPFIHEFSTSSNADRFLFVQSNYVNTAMGKLHEYVVHSGTVEPLLSSADTNIGFALYISNDSILYYTYGESISSNQNPQDAGYYIYDRIRNEKTLMFHYISDIGPHEMLNSFDVSPDGRKLLIAAVGDRKPFLIEYDIKSRTADTLDLDFPDVNGLRALYIKYNHKGSHAVYSMYPFGTRVGEVSLTQSSLGIIDLQGKSISEFQAQPSSDKTWLSLWPSWSPDDKQILYVAAAVSKEPAGSLTIFNLCIIKIP